MTVIRDKLPCCHSSSQTSLFARDVLIRPGVLSTDIRRTVRQLGLCMRHCHAVKPHTPSSSIRCLRCEVSCETGGNSCHHSRQIIVVHGIYIVVSARTAAVCVAAIQHVSCCSNVVVVFPVRSAASQSVTCRPTFNTGLMTEKLILTVLAKT
jgi:hypothetical protein